MNKRQADKVRSKQWFKEFQKVDNYMNRFGDFADLDMTGKSPSEILIEKIERAIIMNYADVQSEMKIRAIEPCDKHEGRLCLVIDTKPDEANKRVCCPKDKEGYYLALSPSLMQAKGLSEN